MSPDLQVRSEIGIRAGMRRRDSSWTPDISGDRDARKSDPVSAAVTIGDDARVAATDENGARTSRRKPTMTDVARIAGVSQTSVSLILNRMVGARISEATRDRVFEAAREIGYELPGSRRPYVAASERNVIAYVVDEISTSPHPVVSFDGARDAGWESGFLVAAHVTRSNSELEATTIDAIRRDPHVIGVIYSTIFTRRVSLPDELYRLPTVLLNCHSADRRLHSIVPGEVAGALHATEYLVGKAHRRIGFINGEPWMEASADRLKGYRQALGAAAIAFDPCL